MRKILYAGIAVIITCGPVLAQSVGEKTGLNSLTGAAPSTQDFVTEAAVSDMFEIQSSQIADQKANGPAKDFADHMVSDH